MEVDRSVPVEPSGSRLRPPLALSRKRVAWAVSEVAGTLKTAMTERNRAVGAKERQHPMKRIAARSPRRDGHRATAASMCLPCSTVRSCR